MQYGATTTFLATLGMIGAIVSTAVGEIEYQLPSQQLVDIVNAPRTPQVSVGPTHQWMLFQELSELPSIAELAQPELKLAGQRISPTVKGPSRSAHYVGLSLQNIETGEKRPVTGLPDPTMVRSVSWSPDGTKISIACTISENGALDRIEPWVVDLETGAARRVAEVALNLCARTSPRWLPDSSALIAVLTTDKLGLAPTESPVPNGPVVQANDGKTAPARTYQDLLKNEHDADLFEHYFTGQVAQLSLDGTVTPLGSPMVVWNLSISPSGEYILATTLHRPYSFRVPAARFPRRVEIWDRAGKVVHQVADLPAQEEIPIAFGSVAKGPRSVSWRADVPATIVWAEALDGGDARVEAEHRDRVFSLSAPFDGERQILATCGMRYGGITWCNGDLALMSEYWWKTRMRRMWELAPDVPESPPALMEEYSFEDRYNDPGAPETTLNKAGRRVLMLGANGDSIFRSGPGASADGDRPFFDEFSLASHESRRLLRSEPPHYEFPLQLMDLDEDGAPWHLLTRRESVDQPPNYFLRDLKTGTEKQLTDFKHPLPQMKGVKKELIRYKRDDGLDLTATLFLPQGYEPEQGPIPLLMWAYPTEFKNRDAAGQVQGSPYRFNRVNSWSPMVFTALGYAVLDDPTMPIIGEGDVEPNDSYVEQLVSSAKAAVDEVVRRGVTDHGMIAIGGHSYGAFMTANLLAHTDLFSAGIARSGAYNRTLTPFGFQSEERSLWEAPDVYFAMSPFMHADKINEPLLMIHGAMDSNSGTYPMQSERFFSALKGQGATTRLVMLPYESHGYQARESLLHMLWEQEQWLKQYTKKPSGETVEKSAPSDAEKQRS